MFNYKYLSYLFIVFGGLMMAFILNQNSVQKKNNSKTELPKDLSKQNNTINVITIGNITAKLPNGWIQEAPKSSMRLAQFKLPSNENQYSDAELSVFNSIGGSVQENLDRWYNQFEQEDGVLSKQKARVRDFSIGDMNITITDLKGIFTGGGMPMSQSIRKKNYRLLAAIVQTSNEIYYFKLIGHEVVISNWAITFGEFIGNLRQI